MQHSAFNNKIRIVQNNKKKRIVKRHLSYRNRMCMCIESARHIHISPITYAALADYVGSTVSICTCIISTRIEKRVELKKTKKL